MNNKHLSLKETVIIDKLLSIIEKSINFLGPKILTAEEAIDYLTAARYLEHTCQRPAPGILEVENYLIDIGKEDFFMRSSIQLKRLNEDKFDKIQISFSERPKNFKATISTLEKAISMMRALRTEENISMVCWTGEFMLKSVDEFVEQAEKLPDFKSARVIIRKD